MTDPISPSARFVLKESLAELRAAVLAVAVVAVAVVVAAASNWRRAHRSKALVPVAQLFYTELVMPAVEAAKQRVYTLRKIAQAGLESAQRALPMPFSTRMRRLFPVYSWRDPDGRFHVVAIPRRGGGPVIISFWRDELRSMMRRRVLEIIPFEVDPLLSTTDVAFMAARKQAPEGWLRQTFFRSNGDGFAKNARKSSHIP